MAFSSPRSLVGLAQFAGRIACLIVVAWLLVFVVDQTGNASAQQQSAVEQGTPQPGAHSPSSTQSPSGTQSPSSAESPAGARAQSRESGPHKMLNEVAEVLTAPFAAAVAGSHSQWVIHIVETLLALLVYGVAIGFLVRFVRLRF